MAKLNALLARYATTPPKMGAAAPFPTDALRRDLETLLRPAFLFLAQTPSISQSHLAF